MLAGGGLEKWRPVLKNRIPFPYVRVSSKPQGRDDRYGPKTQREAELYAIKVIKLPPARRFYEDHITGRSASKRLEFQRLLTDAKGLGRGKAVILALDVSRWARSEVDALWYMEQATKANIPILFIGDDLLTIYSPGDWRSRFADLAREAAALSRTISRKVRDANVRKWESLGFNGQAAFGYRRTADRKSIEVDPKTIGRRLLAFREFATGKYDSCDKLAAAFERRGIKFGDRFMGGPGLRVLLRNPVVIGTLRYQRSAPPDRPDEKPELDERPSAIKAALDKKTWNKVQQILDDHDLGWGNGAGQPKWVHTFSGARCLTCNEKYYCHRDTRGNLRLVHRIDRGCRRGIRGQYKLVRTLEHWFENWKLPADARDQLERASARPRETHPARARDAEVKRINRAIAAVTRELTRGKLTDDAWSAKVKALQQEKRRALLGAAPAPAPNQKLADFRKLVPALANLRNAPLEQRRDLVRELFVHTWVGKNGQLKVELRPEYAPLVRLALGRSARVGASAFIIDHDGSSRAA